MKATASPSVRQQPSMQPTRSQARFAFIVLLVINILNYIDRSIFSSIQTVVQVGFHLTDIQLGLLNSSFLFIYGLATLPIGMWADRGVQKIL